jgi:hypothetical protein
VLPHGHLAVSYLLYTGLSRVWLGRGLSAAAVTFLTIGSQFPDLVDKPLWLLGVLESGRSLGHSLLIGLPFVVVVALGLHQRMGSYEPGAAFGVSYVAATVADGSIFFLQGSVVRDLVEVSFWVWPLSLPAEYLVNSLREFPVVVEIINTKQTWTAAAFPSGTNLRRVIRFAEVVFSSMAVVVWLADGTPGTSLMDSIADSLQLK